jgi:hypothetical protein
MDVYQRVLLKVYEMANGKDTEEIDLANLLKREGFFANLPSIHEHFINQSWIVATPRKNFIRLTHWGIREAKKLKDSDSGSNSHQNINKEVNRLIAESREFISLLEDYLNESTKENFSRAESKFSELNSAISKLKSGIL